ncbi:MAG: hypothetical protein HKP46_19980 [Myxococcales bacterium]|nr:hypothetical protein [Myxococcales bacterium]
MVGQGNEPEGSVVSTEGVVVGKSEKVCQASNIGGGIGALVNESEAGSGAVQHQLPQLLDVLGTVGPLGVQKEDANEDEPEFVGDCNGTGGRVGGPLEMQAVDLIIAASRS